MGSAETEPFCAQSTGLPCTTSWRLSPQRSPPLFLSAEAAGITNHAVEPEQMNEEVDHGG
eukprot:14890051-Heterocapsa_arctica.AAC.1